MMISAQNVVEKMNLEVLCLPDPDAEITDAYTGDLLSWVMGRSSAGQAWVTIMTNINIVAVASLQELPLVILCDNSRPDDDVIARARENGINLAMTAESSFHVCAQLAKLLE